MKKSFKRVLAVVMSVVILASTSVISFAETTGEDVQNSFNEWMDSLTNYKWEDFFGFVTAILRVFGFQGSFEGVHSLPELVGEWFEMLGPIGDFYDNFINNINTGELLGFLLGFIGQ
ncbi:MAG: hypothetical protein IJ261_04605 [Clostridia bacterium]|nr:hypothetical protein [Clostridia bacterium]